MHAVPNENYALDAWNRVGVWLGSMALAATTLSLGLGSYAGASMTPTLPDRHLFALPVAVL